MNYLEACCGDIDSVRAAAPIADRIELCCALEIGGLTPSPTMIQAVARMRRPRINVLIRPRGGDFLYDTLEQELMLGDIGDCLRAGVAGVVIGALTPEGDVDMDLCARMVEAAGEMSVTFHRAFDVCRDPEQALEDIIALGCDRILTSGCAPTALEGAPLLKKLNEQAAGRIKLMAGGGVTPANAAEILRLTGLDEIHASAKTMVGSKMVFRRKGVSMGAAVADEYQRPTLSASTLAAIAASIKD